ncbi:hypothetical protein EVAR_94263_1 [Eumeta japonica]|uniref:Uncharacterized protein n=1 Tax=Eumeta variegata TaxID=151549 RepID=A0A4C1UF54_EUMVA|nr:hypothetical protein EVAR_94263_1 [Eumeta japonica]
MMLLKRHVARARSHLGNRRNPSRSTSPVYFGSGVGAARSAIILLRVRARNAPGRRRPRVRPDVRETALGSPGLVYLVFGSQPPTRLSVCTPGAAGACAGTELDDAWLFR